MKIMVVGGGGREHAIIKKLKENKEITEIFALPGNGGMANDATLVDIGAKDIEKQVEFAKANGIDYAVVAPDDPLVLGCVDALEAKGIPCFGPRANAARKRDLGRHAVVPHTGLREDLRHRRILPRAAQHQDARIEKEPS
jgi:phosphoribosylamine-glycine ligase